MKKHHRRPRSSKRATMLHRLEALGFDRSYTIPGGCKVACSECQAFTINGIPAHELGCPNAMHECNGCNTLIPMRQRYCEDCR